MITQINTSFFADLVLFTTFIVDSFLSFVLFGLFFLLQKYFVK